VTVRRRFANAQHVIRVAAVFLAGFLLFLVVRARFIPAGFGAEGFYRMGARVEAMSKPLAYGGEAECISCHNEQDDVRKAGRHAKVKCEACHGPSWKHTQEATDVHTPKIDLPALCLRCHTRTAGKPALIPQVVAASHYPGRACESCHQPHKPKAEKSKEPVK
jgi:hypothetical protein